MKLNLFTTVLLLCCLISSCKQEEVKPETTSAIFFEDKEKLPNSLYFEVRTRTSEEFDYTFNGCFIKDGVRIPKEEVSVYINNFLLKDSYDFNCIRSEIFHRSDLGKNLNAKDGQPIELFVDHPTVGFRSTFLNFPNLWIDSLNYTDRVVSKSIGSTYTWIPHNFSTDTTRMRVILSYSIRDSLNKSISTKTKSIDIPDNGVFHLTPELLTDFPPTDNFVIYFDRASYIEFQRNDGERVAFTKQSSHFGAINLKP